MLVVVQSFVESVQHAYGEWVGQITFDKVFCDSVNAWPGLMCFNVEAQHVTLDSCGSGLSASHTRFMPRICAA